MPVVDVVPYPPAFPTVTNDIEAMSVFLRDPVYVQRAIENITLNRFITPQIFRAGPPATTGAVVYDQVTGNLLYPTRRAAKVAPGGELRRTGVNKPTPKVATVDKWGEYIEITDEDIRRLNFNAITRGLTQIGNEIVRTTNQEALAVLASSPVDTYGFDATWAASSTFQPIFEGLAEAKQQMLDRQMGYNPDTLIISGTQNVRMLSLAVKDKVLGEVAQERVVRDGTTGRVLDFDIYWSPDVTPGTAWYLDSRFAGQISEEVPLFTETWREPKRQSQAVSGSKSFTAYVTDPYAVIYMTGL